jgi:hypothetical protein
MSKKSENLMTKISIFELAEKLSKGEVIQLKTKESLCMSSFEITDFMAIANEENLEKKLLILQSVLARFNIQLQLDGAITLGAMNLDDRSWTITASNEDKLKISSRPLPMKIALSELVNFLKKLPIGQGLILKPNQDVIVTGFSEESVQNFFELSKSTQDLTVLEKTQDQFFIQSSELLAKEGLCLKMFAHEARMMNREVNPSFGAVAFIPQGDETLKEPKMIAALVKQEG